MKRFVRKILFFFLPLAMIVAVVIGIDFFKIFGFQDYYEGNTIGLNREMVCTTTYNEYHKQEKFDSFIFGSSRSQAFKCKEWAQYINDDAVPFHFDASGEGVWGISMKMNYVVECGGTIENAIIVLDRETLITTKARKGHLFVPMPCVSKASNYDYYLTYIKASLDGEFLLAYSDYSMFGEHKEYMGHLIRKTKYDHKPNRINCDLWYGYDDHIRDDSLGYYKALIEDETFYDRPVVEFLKCDITQEEIDQLQTIKRILKKFKTNYKIVISPVYDQIPLENKQLKLLHEIFGKENVYDYSGINTMTNEISNYYEASHYRVHIADGILKEMYRND
ncbi:MAG: hypothetical protein ACI865_000604 [Flavobacteriaceae bacterium]|jgi:hypothetical protein